MNTPPIGILRRALLAAALVPAALLVYDAYAGNLTANPVEYLENETGDWAIIFLIASLAITPIRRLTGWNEVIRLRKMFGLVAYFYAAVHVVIWFTLVSYFDVPTMVEDVLMRPFITVGMATFLILTALAVTSTTGAIRRLGRRWQQLHRAVYVAAIGAVVHFWWLVKADITRPRQWAVVLTLLLGFRLWWMWRARTLSRS
ncbi:MAG: protein-methionine-sulfoxide reductase heme-binding subunit MsrQ [Vicinamibacterales bacterium]